MSRTAPKEIRVGLGTCGVASGGRPVKAAVDEAVARIGSGILVKAVGCGGMCHKEPIVEVVGSDGERQIFGDVDPGVARRLVRQHVLPRTVGRRLSAMVDRVADFLFSDRKALIRLDGDLAESWTATSTIGVAAARLEGNSKRRQLRVAWGGKCTAGKCPPRGPADCWKVALGARLRAPWRTTLRWYCSTRPPRASTPSPNS